jgi:hypothetical protein
MGNIRPPRDHNDDDDAEDEHDGRKGTDAELDDDLEPAVVRAAGRRTASDQIRKRLLTGVRRRRKRQDMTRRACGDRGQR